MTMTTRNFTDLRTMFSNQSRDIWQRLSYVKDSYKTRGPFGPVRLGEETITDLIMMDLYLRGFTLSHFTHTAKPDEAMWGTDFELWVVSDLLGWFRFALQVKKLTLTDDRYSSLTQGNSNGDRIDLLEQYARLNRAAPLYCLYNYTEYADELRHYHCGDGQHDLKELGCTVTPSSNIRGAPRISTVSTAKRTPCLGAASFLAPWCSNRLCRCQRAYRARLTWIPSLCLTRGLVITQCCRGLSAGTAAESG